MARYFRFYEKKRGDRRTGSRKIGSLGEGLFYLALMLIGLGSLIAIFLTLVNPVWQANRHYTQHTCLVLDKRLERDEQRDRVYRAVQIEYEVRGKTYRPWVYDAQGVYTGSRLEAVEDLSAFHVGAVAACWYDPRNPGTAVVDLQSSTLGWLLLLVPLAFVVLGGVGLSYDIVRWGKSAERSAVIGRRFRQLELFDSPAERGHLYPGIPPVGDVTDSPGTRLAYRLPVDTSPAWKLAGYLAACVLWASGTTILIWFTIDGHLLGEPNWVLSAFTLPFALIGIWLVVAFVRQLLITTRRGATWVEISAHPLRPGGRYEVFVSQGGRLHFESLRVSLVCEEIATYRMGTDTRTEIRRVAEHELIRRDDFAPRPGSPFEKLQPFNVPESAMHSFRAEHNSIDWKIVVQGDIVQGNVAHGPGFRREFPVLLYPPSNAGDRS